MHGTLNNLLQADGIAQSVTRKAAILAALVVMVLSGRALVADMRYPIASTASSTAVNPLAVAHKVSAQESATRIGQAHLFGNVQALQSALPLQTVSDVTLSGILFSDRQEDSYAILVVGGQTAVVAAGGKLPDGEILHAVAEDGVILDRNGTLVRVPLDIKRADSNSRTPMIALDRSTQGEDAGPAIAPMSEPSDTDQPKAAWNNQQGMGQGLMTHGTFVPLNAIRGDQARLRLAMPGSKPPGAPQQ